MYSWVEDSGMKGQVCTLFELASSEEYLDQEFHGLDPAVLLKALKILETDGKAQIFQGTNPDDRGVKFF